MDVKAIKMRAKQALSLCDLFDEERVEEVIFNLLKNETFSVLKRMGTDPDHQSEEEFDKIKFVVLGAIREAYEELVENSLHKRIIDQFHKAFWDLLTEDLQQVPPKTDHLLTLLQEVKQRINCLTPNNIKMHKEMDEAIDIPYFEHLFSHQVFNGEMLIGTINFLLVDRLKRLIAPVDDEEYDLWHKEVIQQLKTVPLPPYHQIVPDVLRKVYYWIEKIERGIQSFRQ